MRQLNVKFLVGLVAVTVMLAGGLFLVHRAQAGRIARALRRQAERADQQGRPDQKVKYLARYLEFVPDDNDSRAELGRTLTSPEVAVTARVRERSLFVLERVLLQEPDRHDSRRLLVQVALQLGRPELAKEHLDYLEKQRPDDGEVRRLLGQWYEARNDEHEGDLSRAVRYYREAIEQAPADVESYVRLARLLRRRPDLEKKEERKELPASDKVMEDLVTRNDRAFQAYLARWQYRKEFHPLKEAQELEWAGQDVARALELAPDEAGVIRAAAELAQLRKQPDEARGHLERGLKLHPRDGSLYQALARLEVEAQRRKEAVACLRQGIRTLPQGPAQGELLWTLTNLLIDDDNLPEAELAVGQMRQARSSPAGIDYLSARLMIKKGQWAEAARLLERTRPFLEAVPDLSRQADVHLSQCYERLDEPAGHRLALYERMVQRNPGSVSARQAIVNSLCAMERYDEALEQYRQMMALPDAPAGGWTQMARLMILRNLRRGQANWQEVDGILRKAGEAQPGAVEVIVLKSEMLQAQKRPDEARKLLEAARDQEPKQVAWWAALALLAERQGKPDEARDLLEQAGKHCADTVELRLAWARYWSARRGDEAKAALPRMADKAEQLPAEDQARLLLGLVEAQCRLSDFAAAEQLWGKLARQERYQNDLRVQQLWFDLVLQAGDADTLKRVLETIRGIEQGEGPLWNYGEALRLIRLARKGQKEGLDEARARLDAVAARRPSWPAVYLARAAVEDLKGNTEQAIANYRRAIALGERGPQATRELVQLLHRRQRFAEAEQEIRRLEKQTALSPELKRLAADISLHNNDLARAVTFATDVTKQTSDYRDHLWLGQVLAARGQASPEAEDSLRRAVELAGEVPETWVALVRYLAVTRQEDKAREELARAEKKLPAKVAPLALAQCCEVLDRPDDVLKHYQAALESQPRDAAVLRGAAGFFLRVGRSRDAETVLRRLIDGRVDAAGADVAWARRSLALALANHGDYRRFPEALALVGLRLEDETRVVEEKKPPEAEAADEQRARARLLVTSNRGSLRRHAIGFLEDVARSQALTLDDQFLLAQLYEAAGDWAKAREQFRSLTAGPGAGPLALAHAARSFLRRREREEAERCISRLEQAEKAHQAGPGQFGSVELRAQWLETGAKGPEAVALLKAHAERPGASPEFALLLAACLARQDRVKEALGVCEQVWPHCPPEAVGGAAVAALRTAPSGREHCTHVERLLLEAIQKHPANTVLLLHLADVRDLQERYDDAAALYRQVLDREKGNIVALNNLAWLLAQKPAGAAEALERINHAIQLVGPRAELLDTRAAAQLALGKTDLAVADLERSNAETPSGSRYFHLARAHQQANNPGAAAEALRKAKASGLAAEQLHPVERVAFQKMLEEFKE